VFLKSSFIIYPEGDVQEIDHSLSINQLVDLNGNPLQLPLPTTKMIVYRVYKINVKTPTGQEIRQHYLELVNVNELEQFAKWFFKFTSEKATTCGGGLKVAKLVVAFSSTLHPYGVLPHIPPALLVVCWFHINDY
jgi:hypothetical protein